MSIRTFIFCDICNPQAIRSVEFRRGNRDSNREGRRLSDGRTWFDGDLSAAVKNGWVFSSEGKHICPHCQKSNKLD